MTKTKRVKFDFNERSLVSLERLREQGAFVMSDAPDCSTATAIKERPILFSAPMVRAILAGRKTQTRRIVKLKDPSGTYCRYGEPGERLWVRETWANALNNARRSNPLITYKASCASAMLVVDRDGRKSICEYDGVPAVTGPWKPSIHMPRWASRITLEITSVRVERLYEISNEDAVAEGVRCPCGYHYCTQCHTTPVQMFAELWASIHAAHGPHGWKAKPWVWVIEFKKI